MTAHVQGGRNRQNICRYLWWAKLRGCAHRCLYVRADASCITKLVLRFLVLDRAHPHGGINNSKMTPELPVPGKTKQQSHQQGLLNHIHCPGAMLVLKEELASLYGPIESSAPRAACSQLSPICTLHTVQCRKNNQSDLLDHRINLTGIKSQTSSLSRGSSPPAYIH